MPIVYLTTIYRNVADPANQHVQSLRIQVKTSTIRLTKRDRLIQPERNGGTQSLVLTELDVSFHQNYNYSQEKSHQKYHFYGTIWCSKFPSLSIN